MNPRGQSAKSAKQAQSQLAELKELGRYKIQRIVGAGGMGTVFKATDGELRRVVALKVLPKDKAKNPTLVSRFKAEAQAAAHLNHDNIVRVYDHGEVDGFLFIAMEYISGVDVHQLMERQGTLSPKRSLDIVKQVTRALTHAFEKNIVHRDIKPSNLMIDKEGTIKLADMGLARCMSDSESASLTQAGSTVGTVDYMSPEQARDSKSADTRSDMYSLGATWYHMLVGTPPFAEGDLLNRIHAHCAKPVPDPREQDPDIPDAIVDIIMKLMEKEPADRYQTPSDLLHDLENADLDRKEISIDLLASLGTGEESGLIDVPTLKNRSRSRDEPARSKPEAQPTKETSRESKLQASEARRTRVAAKQAQAEANRESRRSRARKPSKSRPESRETRADHETAESSVPSARDALLNQPMLRRGMANRKKKMDVSLDTGRLFGIVAGVAALLIVGALVVSEFRNSSTGTDESPGTSRPETVNTVEPSAPVMQEPIPGSIPNSSQPR